MLVVSLTETILNRWTLLNQAKRRCSVKTLSITKLKPNRAGIDRPAGGPLDRTQFAFGGMVAKIHFHRFMLSGCLFVLLLAAKAGGAQPLRAAIVFHPGDTLRLMVTFKEGMAFDSGTARFCMQGEPRNGQQAFSRCVFAELKKPNSAEHTYEFSAALNNQVTAGEFRLEMIRISANGLSRVYNPGSDFQPLTPIQIENSNRVDFPDITGITVQGPGGTPANIVGSGVIIEHL
jgi:hypothetical protein